MCDYSLMEYESRLALEGEVLVTHRFPSGSLGLASPQEVCGGEAKPVRTRTLWGNLKEFFAPSDVQTVPAVCIPPGARLTLHDVAAEVQKALAVGPVEEVTFIQMSAKAYAHRDAVRFRTGHTLPLQVLREGQRVEVVDLGCGTLEEPNTATISETFSAVPAYRRF